MNVAATGLGLIVVALVGFGMALTKHNNPIDYLVYGGLSFTLSFGAGLVVTRLPAGYLMVLEYLDRAAVLRLRIFQSESQIGRNPVVESGPTPKIVYDRNAKWREWFISAFEVAEDSIHYSGHLDAFMDYRLWRHVFCKTLSDHNPPLIEPVSGGDRTVLRGGLTVPAILTLLRSGMLSLPCPDQFDPPPKLTRQTQTQETR